MSTISKMTRLFPIKTETEEEAAHTAAGVHLPPDVLYDVLSRLPAKSIARFRCVSKHWRIVLSDRQFLKTQFILNNHQPKIIFQHNFSTLSIDFCKNGTDNRVPIGIPGTLDFRHSNRSFRICGSCNGLILLHDFENCELLVVNPLTRESRKLPPLPIAETRRYYVAYGFGYCSNDNDDDDYVVVIHPVPNRQLFMFKRNCWKIVDNSPLSLGSGCGIFVNEAIHWLGYPIPGSFKRIYALDLAGETVREVEYPEGFKEVDEIDENWFTVDVFGGRLCLVYHKWNSATNIWVMKEYGVRESWTKYLANIMPTIYSLQPLFFWNDDESVIIVHEGNLVLCCLKQKTSTIIPVVGDQLSTVTYLRVWDFAESLFSPNSGNAVEGPNQVQV